MNLTFLGTGTAIPSDRAQSGLLLEDDPLLFDCGSGTLQNLEQSPIGFDKIGHILLTHMHLDHVADLLPLLQAGWLAGRETVHVYGPPGTREMVNCQFGCFEYLDGEIDVTITEIEPGISFDVASRRVRTLPTRHDLPSMAYRIDDAFVYSGDTEPIDEMAAFASGSDVLIHECSFPDDIDITIGQHTQPTGLADVLADSDVNRVYLTHFYPHVQGNEEQMIATIRERFNGEVQFGEDLNRVTIHE